MISVYTLALLKTHLPHLFDYKSIAPMVYIHFIDVWKYVKP